MQQFLKAVLLYSILSLTVAYAASSQEASLLWKIEGNGLAEPSWLYGTQHLMCGEDFVVSETALEHLKSSDILALEINLSDPAVMQQMMQPPRLPGGKRIEDFIEDEVQAEIDSFLAGHLGGGLDQFGDIQPAWLSVMVIPAIVSCEQQIQSHDIHLMQAALAQGVKITGLETIELQFGLFEEIPLDQQLNELVSLVENPDAALNEFRSLTTMYINQDIDGLYNMIVEDEFWQLHRDLLLDQRNQAWIPEMKNVLGDQRAFFAVGAGHLAGENGVINLLREAGYTLTPVTDQD